MAEYLFDPWGPRSSRAITLGATPGGDMTAGGGPLSIKAYTVSGVTVWGSYQSPTTDAILKAMKAQINRFCAGLDPNGLIGPKTVDALRQIAGRYTNPNPQALALKGLATSPEAVARAARGITTLVKSLADATMLMACPGSGESNTYPGAPTAAQRAYVAAQESGRASIPTSSAIAPYDPAASYATGGGIMATFEGMSQTTKMALGAGVVVGAFLLARRGKKGKKR